MEFKFVEHIPESIEENNLYLSIKYNTAIHKCCCGCGNEIVTPFAPQKWKLIYDGQTVSLSPSIGSWNLPCKSHYWIYEGQIIWSKKWNREEIELAREKDLDDITSFYTSPKFGNVKNKNRKS